MSATKFTLVHGTFSATADWVNNSAVDDANGFRAKLAKKFTQSVSFCTPPAWGSKRLIPFTDLTNAKRLDGAAKLQKHILETDDQANHFVVAHSHGGNVAMYALQDDAVAQKVDGLICLATPFLYPRRRPLSVIALILSLGIMLVGVMQFIWSAGHSDPGSLSWLTIASLFVFTVAVPACLTWLVAFERYKYKYRDDSRLDTLIDKLSYKDPNIPILLIRASGDEASGLLRGAQFLNWLGGVGMRLGGRQIYLLVCAVALTVSWMAYQGSDMVPEFIVPLLKQGLIISAALMVILLMALTLSRIFVGFDAWRWVGEIETMVEDGPPGIAAEMVVSTPSGNGSGLSHTSIYESDETLEIIAKWCNKIIANK